MDIKLNQGGSFNVLDHSGNALLSAVDGNGNIAFDGEIDITYSYGQSPKIPAAMCTKLLALSSGYYTYKAKGYAGVAVIFKQPYAYVSVTLYPSYINTMAILWSGSVTSDSADVTLSTRSFIPQYPSSPSAESASAWDTAPTASSTKPVTSGGIKTYVDSNKGTKLYKHEIKFNPGIQYTNKQTYITIYDTNSTAISIDSLSSRINSSIKTNFTTAISGGPNTYYMLADYLSSDLPTRGFHMYSSSCKKVAFKLAYSSPNYLIKVCYSDTSTPSIDPTTGNSPTQTFTEVNATEYEDVVTAL